MRRKSISLRVRLTEEQYNFLERLSRTTELPLQDCLRFCINIANSLLNSSSTAIIMRNTLRDALEKIRLESAYKTINKRKDVEK
jgi:hypothetical protein